MLDSFNFVIVLPIIAGFLFCIACIVPFFIDPRTFYASRLSIFIQILAPIGVIMIGLSIFNSSADFELRKESQKTLLYKERLSSMFLQPTVEIFMTPNVRSEFYASFYSNNLQLYQLVKNQTTPSTPASEMAEQYVSTRILQVFEDYMQEQKIHDIADPVWLAIFIQWGQSQYLKRHFELLKCNFDDTTVDFVNLIFEYAKDIPIPTTDQEAYIKAGNKMFIDERLAAINEKAKEDKF